jgi:hypothetical protein
LYYPGERVKSDLIKKTEILKGPAPKGAGPFFLFTFQGVFMDYTVIAVGEIRDASPRILWAIMNVFGNSGFCSVEQTIYEQQCNLENENGA